MVLADTLALAGRTRPTLIIDYATLTGACVTALGERMSGIFVQPPALAQAALAAGESSGERVWNFPLDSDYDASLRARLPMSCNARRTARRTIFLAARFLSRFVPDATAWIHMDLAAAVRSGGLAHINTDITGFGVRYTLELLRGGNCPWRRESRTDEDSDPAPSPMTGICTCAMAPRWPRCCRSRRHALAARSSCRT